MSILEGSCPICYESYTQTNEGDHIPRRMMLCCQYILCSNCIVNDLCDESFYCPQCYVENKGSLDDFSMIATAEDVNTQSIDEDDDTLDPQNNGQYSSGANESNVQLSPRAPRQNCTVVDCKNKAISNGLCLIHSKHRAKSMSVVDSIARNMLNTSFNIIAEGGKLIAPSNPAALLTPDAIMERFKQQKRLELGEAMQLIDEAKSILIRESNILSLEAPIVAVGDIHGQFYDLANLFAEGGKPGEQEQYLFLGDYVDRGSFSCEVMFMLVALKITYPTRIWLLRGNHECASVSGHFGFKEECKMKYGVNVYYNFLLLFQTMPLAAIISTAYGDIFACHGGLSPALKTLDDISKLNRLVEPEADSSLLDILWSDPISEDGIDSMNDEDYENYMNIEWKSNPARGCSFAFGYKAVREFLDRNGLVCVIRAHEVQELGFKKHFEPEVMEARIKKLLRKRTSLPELNTHGVQGSGSCMISVGKEKDIPPLITIFSAPNYCDRYHNKGAILRIESGLDGFQVIQYDCVEHPAPEIQESQTDNYILAITAACPYMPTSFRGFVRRAVELGFEESQNLVNNEDDPEIDDQNSKIDEKESPESASEAVGNVGDNCGADGANLASTPSDEKPKRRASNVIVQQSPGGTPRHSISEGTPRHDEFNADNPSDINRYLKAFPVRRGSVRAMSITVDESQVESPVAQVSVLHIPKSNDSPVVPIANGVPLDVSEQQEDKPKRGLFRRGSITISMVRTATIEDNDDYNEPILANFDDDSIDDQACISGTPSSPGRSKLFNEPLGSVDEFGLEMHDDVALDESTPPPQVVGSSQKIRRVQMVDDEPSATALSTPQFGRGDGGDVIPAPRRDPFDTLLKRYGDTDKIPNAKSPADHLQATPMRDSDHSKASSVTQSKSSTAVKLFASIEDDQGVSSPALPTSRNEIAVRTPSGGVVTRSKARALAAETPVRSNVGISTPTHAMVTRSRGRADPIELKSDRRVPQQMRRRGSAANISATSEAYQEAQASDSINEVHPQMLKAKLEDVSRSPKMVEDIAQKFNMFKEVKFKELARKVIQTNVSVKDMKKRFEREKATSSDVSPTKKATVIGSKTDSGKIADVLKTWQQQSSAHNPPVAISQPTSASLTSTANIVDASDAKVDSVEAVNDLSASVSRLEVAALAKVDRVASIQAKFGGSVRQASIRKSLGSSDPFGLNSGPEEKIIAEELLVSTEVKSSSHSRPHSMPALGRRVYSTEPADDDIDLSAHRGLSFANDPLGGNVSDRLLPHEPIQPASAGESLLRRAFSDPTQAAAESESSPIIHNKLQRSVSDPVPFSKDATALTDTEDNHTEVDEDNILFSQSEILALKLMFSLFDRSGSTFIDYEDLVAYGEETGSHTDEQTGICVMILGIVDGVMGIGDAAIALEIVDIDGDGRIGLLDFIHFAARLKAAHEKIVDESDIHDPN